MTGRRPELGGVGGARSAGNLGGTSFSQVPGSREVEAVLHLRVFGFRVYRVKG